MRCPIGARQDRGRITPGGVHALPLLRESVRRFEPRESIAIPLWVHPGAAGTWTPSRPFEVLDDRAQLEVPGNPASRPSRRLALVLAILLLALLVHAPATAQQQTVGLFLDDPRAYAGYTLLPPLMYTKTYLIDDAGLLVHSWTSDSAPGDSAYLLENGHLLRTAQVTNAVFNAGGAGGRVQDYDWDGTAVWDFTYSSSLHLQHHDVERLPNGNVLLIAWELRSRAQAIAAGRNPSLVSNSGLWPDTIIEVQPAGPAGGTIVWEWHVWDHLIQDFDATKPNFGAVASHPELIDLNFARGPASDWNHTNSIDYSPGFDQILISSHAFSEIWVLDHSTTTQLAAGHAGGNSGKGGDLLYRWGNPRAYRAGATSDQKLFGQHDGQWIVPGSPGAGDISILNNGQGRPSGAFSTVEEIVPPVDASGHYQLVPGSAFGPAAQAWIYSATNPTDFYTMNIGGAQRLPNGNTLVCEGTEGNLFEVTATGETVWRYLNPVTGSGPLKQGDAIPQSNSNLVFKVRRYAANDPALAGRDLTPGFPVEGNPVIPYPVLRAALPSLGEPPGQYLPLDPAQDLYTTVSASPLLAPGDGAPSAAPLIYYAISNATYLRAYRQGPDVRLEFHY